MNLQNQVFPVKLSYTGDWGILPCLFSQCIASCFNKFSFSKHQKKNILAAFLPVTNLVFSSQMSVQPEFIYFLC